MKLTIVQENIQKFSKPIQHFNRGSQGFRAALTPPGKARYGVMVWGYGQGREGYTPSGFLNSIKVSCISYKQKKIF
jgi:hypothetical protein